MASHLFDHHLTIMGGEGRRLMKSATRESGSRGSSDSPVTPKTVTCTYWTHPRQSLARETASCTYWTHASQSVARKTVSCTYGTHARQSADRGWASSYSRSASSTSRMKMRLSSARTRSVDTPKTVSCTYWTRPRQSVARRAAFDHQLTTILLGYKV